jgi:hypothetical protein
LRKDNTTITGIKTLPALNRKVFRRSKARNKT